MAGRLPVSSSSPLHVLTLGCLFLAFFAHLDVGSRLTSLYLESGRSLAPRDPNFDRTFARTRFDGVVPSRNVTVTLYPKRASFSRIIIVRLEA